MFISYVKHIHCLVESCLKNKLASSNVLMAAGENRSKNLLISPSQPKSGRGTSSVPRDVMFLPNSALPFCHLRAESVLHHRAACFCPQHVNTPEFCCRITRLREATAEISGWCFLILLETLV